MLILLPASERKTPVTRGKPFEPDRLSFPALAATRSAVLDALAEVSAGPDALRRLDVRASLSDLVRANVTLGEAPAAPAGTVYAGPLYEGLGLADLDAASRRRARAWIVVISALWGAVRLGDRIPAYRLNMCGRLPGLAHLPDVWRAPLTGVLPAAARRGLIVDCRSAEYATAWRPAGRARRADPRRQAAGFVPRRQVPARAARPPDRHRCPRSATARGAGQRAVGALQGGPAVAGARRPELGAAGHRGVGLRTSSNSNSCRIGIPC